MIDSDTLVKRYEAKILAFYNKLKNSESPTGRLLAEEYAKHFGINTEKEGKV
jgi:hypothetical protein